MTKKNFMEMQRTERQYLNEIEEEWSSYINQQVKEGDEMSALEIVNDDLNRRLNALISVYTKATTESLSEVDVVIKDDGRRRLEVYMG